MFFTSCFHRIIFMHVCWIHQVLSVKHVDIDSNPVLFTLFCFTPEICEHKCKCTTQLKQFMQVCWTHFWIRLSTQAVAWRDNSMAHLLREISSAGVNKYCPSCWEIRTSHFLFSSRWHYILCGFLCLYPSVELKKSSPGCDGSTFLWDTHKSPTAWEFCKQRDNTCFGGNPFIRLMEPHGEQSSSYGTALLQVFSPVKEVKHH